MIIQGCNCLKGNFFLLFILYSCISRIIIIIRSIGFPIKMQLLWSQCIWPVLMAWKIW